MFELLGLFILFIVGIMLLSEGGHLAHMQLFGNEVTPMSKTTFYFVLQDEFPLRIWIFHFFDTPENYFLGQRGGRGT